MKLTVCEKVSSLKMIQKEILCQHLIFSTRKVGHSRLLTYKKKVKLQIQNAVLPENAIYFKSSVTFLHARKNTAAAIFKRQNETSPLDALHAPL